MLGRLLLQILIVAVLFVGGAGGGAWLAAYLTGGSPLAQFIGFLVLPMAFAQALIFWRGLAIIMMLGRWITDGAFRRRALARLRGAPAKNESNSHEENESSEGGDAPVEEERIESHFAGRAWIMVPVAWFICGVAGPVIGLLSSNVGFVSICAIYFGLGLAYGLAMYVTAKAELLPIPLDD